MGQRQQEAAASRAGAAAAQVTIDRQPDECRQMWADLRPRPGEGAQSVLRRYIEYVRGPINARVLRCYAFNDNQRIGLITQEGRP